MAITTIKDNNINVGCNNFMGNNTKQNNNNNNNGKCNLMARSS